MLNVSFSLFSLVSWSVCFIFFSFFFIRFTSCSINNSACGSFISHMALHPTICVQCALCTVHKHHCYFVQSFYQYIWSEAIEKPTIDINLDDSMLAVTQLTLFVCSSPLAGFLVDELA